METFIRAWQGIVPQEICDDTVQAFESVLQDPSKRETVQDNSQQFTDYNLGRKDLAIFFDDERLNFPHLCDAYNRILQNCLLLYIQEFGQLSKVSMNNRGIIKVQKTMPMGGYHTWHFESGEKTTYDRMLVWMVYLNDLQPGEGETEFLYQGLRIPPTKGTVVIWPAGMTHVHRGLTVYSKPKYIATGWFHQVLT